MSVAETYLARLHIRDVNDMLRLSLYIAGIVLLYSLVQDVYLAFFSPLSKFPGPKWRAFSILPRAINLWCGTEDRTIAALHAAYGPVVRTSPRTISFLGSAETWRQLHGFAHSGNPTLVHDKDYNVYDHSFNVTENLLDADTATHTRQRKIISHAFSDKGLREQEAILRTWADKLRCKLQEHATSGNTVDMMKTFNCTTFDIMSDLTFAEPLHMLENSEYVPWMRTIFDHFKAAG